MGQLDIQGPCRQDNDVQREEAGEWERWRRICGAPHSNTHSTRGIVFVTFSSVPTNDWLILPDFVNRSSRLMADMRCSYRVASKSSTNGRVELHTKHATLVKPRH